MAWNSPRYQRAAAALDLLERAREHGAGPIEITVRGPYAGVRYRDRLRAAAVTGDDVAINSTDVEPRRAKLWAAQARGRGWLFQLEVDGRRVTDTIPAAAMLDLLL